MDHQSARHNDHVSGLQRLQKPAKRALRQGRRAALGLKARARGRLLRGEDVACPVCGRSYRRFDPHNGRPAAKCPRCGSLERHRLLWAVLDQLDRPQDVLHFAPERRISGRLRSGATRRYVGVDLDPVGDVSLDICRLPFTDRSFDQIVCCHVLEHIPDDRTALSELARVLRPNGVAVIQVPIGPGPTTDEDFDLGPEERTSRYGQADHVRLYGVDLVERLQNAFSDVTAVYGIDGPTVEVAPSRFSHDGFSSAINLFVCRR